IGHTTVCSQECTLDDVKRVTLTRQVKYPYEKNFKSLKKEIGEESEDGKISHAHGSIHFRDPLWGCDPQFEKRCCLIRFLLKWKMLGAHSPPQEYSILLCK
ncbi:hypothetical protein STEG23_004631, partial [Scotinomys teguina]